MHRSGRTVKTLTATLLACLLPTTALAGPVYLLQLGSYENLPEARARWAELRNKYPSELKQFSVRFQDVNLPPDNFVVYRTQAGALQERADAERVCEKLASRGDECYVVETAMFRPDLAASDEPPLSIVNAVAPDGSVQPQAKLPDMAKSAIESSSDVIKQPSMSRRIVNPVADLPAPDLPDAKLAARSVAPAISELPGMDHPQASVPPVAMTVISPAPALPATPIPAAAPAIGKSALKISRPAMKQDGAMAAAATAASVPTTVPSVPKEMPFASVTPAIKAPVVALPATPIPGAAAPAPITPAPVAVVPPRPITPQISAPAAQPVAPNVSMPAPPKLSARVMEPAVAPSVVTPTSVAPSLVPYPHMMDRPVSAPSATDMSVDDRREAQSAAQNIMFPDQKRLPPPAPPKPSAAKASKQEKEGSFWSAVNPFASDEQIEKDEIIIETPEQQSADGGYVPHSLDPFKDPFAGASEKDAGLAKGPMAKSITPNISPRMEPVAPKEPVASGFPPPPAPSGDGVMDNVRAQRDAAAARRAALAPVPTPKVAVPVEPSVAAVPVEPVTKTETMNVLKPPAPTANMAEIKRKAAGADVEVAEAVRVPLSEGRPLPLAQTLSTRLPAAGELKKMGSPSTKTGEKTLWAQIFYFHTQQAALAYWEAFRAKNPSFPAVRVRVTSPLNSALGHERMVALRVGPFDLNDHIKEICDEVQIQAEMKEQEMFCRPVSEVAGSAVAQFDRLRGGALTDRYEQSQMQSGSSEAMYWVHLGSYPNQATAKENWTRLLQRHKPVLDSAKPNVSVPNMSSAMEQQYRLRAGPYAMRGPADQLCAKMKASGSDCLVVFSR